MGASPVFDLYASAAATAQALTVNYAASTLVSTPRVSDFRHMALYFTISGTTPASIDWRLMGSDDAGTTWFSECSTECLVGVVTHQEIVRHLTDDTGAPTTAATLMVHVYLEDTAFDLIRMEAKRTGGAADTAIHVTAQLLA